MVAKPFDLKVQLERGAVIGAPQNQSVTSAMGCTAWAIEHHFDGMQFVGAARRV